MRLAFDRLPVRHKLTVAGMLTASVALLLTSLAFVAYDRFSFRKAIAADLSTLAEIIGANSTAALEFRDQAAATELLRSLALKRGITAASLFERDGVLLASFGSLRAAGVPAPSESRDDNGLLFSRDRVRVARTVRLKGERLGQLVLESDLEELDKRLVRYVAIVTLFAVACSLVVFKVASTLQRVIARPILALVETARQVSQEKNYSVRADVAVADEMGLLVRTFNDMLAEIQARDEKLREQNAALEREVAERRLAEQELEKSTASLIKSNQELQDFAYVASHDLQEPLRKVQAFGDRLASRYSDTLGPDGLDYLCRMRNAAQRMHTLINDLLLFSRVSTRGQAFLRVDLERVAKEVVSDLEISIESSQAEVSVLDLPTVDADPLQMRQLLQNLIGNALKFRREGLRPRVTVGAMLVPDGNGGPGSCVLRVEDNGIGFEAKYLSRIFGIFQRLHTRGAYPGNGVGLAICRKIVERHGGTITASSCPGSGSTFLVTLPVHQAEESA